MGNFADTLFSMLLGWVQSAVAWLWQVIGLEGVGGLMGWVLDNWLAMALVLCIIGLAVDLAVYIVRWQPYRMWRSYRRRAARQEPPEAYAAPGTEPLWTEPAEAPLPLPEAPLLPPEESLPPAEEMLLQPPPAAPVQRVIPARRRRSAEPAQPYDAQPGYKQPFYPPQWQADQQDGGMQG